METPLKDISINIPSEFLDEIIQVMECGLERAKMPAKTRKLLKEWWEVEKCYVK